VDSNNANGKLISGSNYMTRQLLANDLKMGYLAIENLILKILRRLCREMGDSWWL